MRLTLELLQQAPQALNPAQQRQLLLRGLKIPTIENLGGTNDAYECIDLSDNDLIKVENFPPLKRLRTLMLTNNRVSRIAADAFEPLPGLVSITLTGNKLEKLVDLEPLTKLKTLERLSLLENPVTKVKHYRPYLIHKCGKSLRILDFNRIKDKERKAAGLLFAGERGRKLMDEIAPARTVGKETSNKAPEAAAKVGPSPEVIERIKRAIAEAETIEEVTRLERALKSGVLPEDLRLEEGKADGDAAMDDKAEPASEAKPAEAERPDEKAVEKPAEKSAEKPADVKPADTAKRATDTPKEDDKEQDAKKQKTEEAAKVTEDKSDKKEEEKKDESKDKEKKDDKKEDSDEDLS